MNTFGKYFRVTTFGESHGRGIGCIIDGCSPGLELNWEAVKRQLARRRPGQSKFVTPRDEKDAFVVQSGIEGGRTLGSPISLFFPNSDQRPKDYKDLEGAYRPSHGDYTTMAKYGIRAKSGGGRTSARETVARVAAGAIAEQVLETLSPGLKIVAYVNSVSDLEMPFSQEDVYSREVVDESLVRCPDPVFSQRFENRIQEASDAGDSVGGTIRATVTGLPPGLGEPVFDKLEAVLAHAILSIPATKGIEFGSGFAGTRMRGSEHNDPFFMGESGKVETRTNHSGGIQAGISNGCPIQLRVAFKPVSTIAKPQESVNESGEACTVTARGRHDPCVLPRAVPIVEGMIALTLLDAYLAQ